MGRESQLVSTQHRIRINTDGKAKIVAADWETYLNAALQYLIIGLDGLKKRFWEDGGFVWCEPDDHPLFSKHPFSKVAVILFLLFFKSSWYKRNLPPSSSDDLCLLFCIYPSSIAHSFSGEGSTVCTRTVEPDSVVYRTPLILILQLKMSVLCGARICSPWNSIQRWILLYTLYSVHAELCKNTNFFNIYFYIL